LYLAIGDDGVGFEVGIVRERALEGRGFGIPGMQERVELAGGRFVITSAPGQGTHIDVRFPCAAPFSSLRLAGEESWQGHRDAVLESGWREDSAS
jgi:signal transduction histidine kinase